MKHLITLLVLTFLIASCCNEECPKCGEKKPTDSKVETYRGQVTFIDADNNKLIQLYGTNQTVWSENQNLLDRDIVKLTTENELESFDIEVICSPKINHCHFDGSGEHSKVHISEIGLTDQEQLNYNRTDYISARMRMDDDSKIDTIWVISDFPFIYNADRDTSKEVHGILLKNKNFSFQRINGKYLMFDFTTENHPGH